jgi:hypothetical protein
MSSLAELECQIQALLQNQPSSLQVIGAGEICVVVAWPLEAPVSAMKRLPPHDLDALTSYSESIAAYEHELRCRGIAVAPCEFEFHTPPQGPAVLYLRQPLYANTSLLVQILRRGSHLPDIIDQVLDAIEQIDGRVGLDAQLSNWVDVDGHATLIDTSTPFLRSEHGVDSIDAAMLLRPFPAIVRPALRRLVVPGIVNRYHTPRAAGVDLVANLHKEHLEQFIEPLCARIGTRFGEAITPDEARKYYRSDARLWSAIQAAKRSQRRWERTVRGRTYPFLIPERIQR